MSLLHQSRHALATLDEQGVGSLILTDAGKLNIIGSAAIAQLLAALARLAAEPGLRVLVLRGASEAAFIGGADIGEMAGLDGASARVFIRNLADLCEAVARFPVPVIASCAAGAWAAAWKWRWPVTCACATTRRCLACPRSRWASRR